MENENKINYSPNNFLTPFLRGVSLDRAVVGLLYVRLTPWENGGWKLVDSLNVPSQMGWERAYVIEYGILPDASLMCFYTE